MKITSKKRVSLRVTQLRRTLHVDTQHRRKRAAEISKNPQLLNIELRSFRHWGGTMLAYYSKGNVLLVKRLLGHKYVENTMKYIGMIHF
jgi:integrase